MLFLSFYPRETKHMKKYPFLFCGFTGLCLEILWTGLHSLLRGDASMKGTTSLLMFPHLWLCIPDLPCIQKAEKPSGTSARLPLYCRILPGRIYQRFYPAGFSHVPLGLFRSAPSVQRESSVWTISRSGFSQDCFSKKYLQNLLEKSFPSSI